MMTTPTLRVLAAALAVALSLPAVAGTDPAQVAKISIPGDTTDVLPITQASRLVTFRYDPNRSFAIRALAGAFVNVELPEGETVQGFYLADPVAWTYHVTGDNKRVLIQPTEAGKVTTATLVGSQRSYELTLASVEPGKPWVQRVQWQVPGQEGNGLYWRGQATQTSATPAGPALNPATLRFGYRIVGKAPFAPTTVFDDGTRTYLRFDGVQDVPAVFAQTRDGMEVLDFAVDGGYVVIPSIHDTLVLRLGRDTLTVERR